jgi:hypothetical protein
MTYISYTMTFDDGELATLEAALTYYLAQCEREIANGASVPYWNHKLGIKSIDAKLHDAISRGTRAHERWSRNVDRERARDSVRTPKGHRTRAIPRARSASKKGGRKRKPK